MSVFELDDELEKAVKDSVKDIFGDEELTDTVFGLIKKARRNLSDASADMDIYVNEVIEKLKKSKEDSK